MENESNFVQKVEHLVLFKPSVLEAPCGKSLEAPPVVET